MNYIYHILSIATTFGALSNMTFLGQKCIPILGMCLIPVYQFVIQVYQYECTVQYIQRPPPYHRFSQRCSIFPDGDARARGGDNKTCRQNGISRISKSCQRYGERWQCKEFFTILISIRKGFNKKIGKSMVFCQTPLGPPQIN